MVGTPFCQAVSTKEGEEQAAPGQGRGHKPRVAAERLEALSTAPGPEVAT